MLMTVAELRQFVSTDKTDQALEARLQALELLIRAYTNNNFQRRGYRCNADIMGASFVGDTVPPFAAGDTVEVTESPLNAGLYTVKAVAENSFTVNESLHPENNVVCTKVVYPADVKMGAVNMMKWDLNNREKVGISSETISRHSVTYFDLGADNSIMGYPKALLGFLRPYMRARFGQGLRV
nr:MAG TPA: head to tail adaptor [Bacteriophage sp.]